jgi:RHS repeat-associated protein
MPVATLFSGGARFQQLADERGSVVALTNTSAGLAGVNRYDEYGVASASDRFQYTGQAYLAPGLYHYRARAYAPQLGRFLQTDPIGYRAGMNIYAYVAGDPINQVDPLGLDGAHMPGGESECYRKGGWVKVTKGEGVDHNECRGLGVIWGGGAAPNLRSARSSSTSLAISRGALAATGARRAPPDQSCRFTVSWELSH